MKIALGALSSVLSLILVTGLSTTSVAQTKRRGTTPRKPAAATPKPEPAATQPATPQPAPRRPAAPLNLVVLNGQTLSTNDLEPAVREQLDQVEDKIAAARKEILDLQINTILLQVEANKRRVDTSQLYETEVTRRIPVPTAAQIKKFVDEQRGQFEGMDQASINQQVAAYLQAESEAKLADDLIVRLKRAIPVTMGVDINTPNLSNDAVVATIGGQPLRASVLNERLKPVVYKMRLDAYNLTRQQAEQLVNNLLLLEEARRRQVGPEQIVRSEVSDKVRPPTLADVEKFYNENKARITGDLNSLRNQIATYLQEQERQRLEADLSARLQKTAEVRWLISEPPQPVQNISVDDDPTKGPANAAVTIVEFTDFECPACAAMHPVIEEVLKSYGDRVRFVVRDFPLNRHANARKAAEAANAANAQGKFFEYAALLFKNQKALDVPSLKKYASEIGLDRARFDAALDRGTYAAEVRKDMQDGEMYGVGVTPTIFVNGVQLRALSADGLKEAIDKAAGARATTTPK
ncbi:MAG TPA: thioredoxin domain-containing protein [Pyrinomonadaceae bacterium]|nr:thioredoxin domain-containing protein [Pyrinomonadaceae bacterium]